MAIKSTITTIQGINLTSAYINLQNPQIQKVKTIIPATETEPESIVTTYKLGANACVYADKDAYDAGKIPIEGFSVVCDIDLEQNVYEQGYTALKQSPRLSEIVDC